MYKSKQINFALYHKIFQCHNYFHVKYINCNVTSIGVRIFSNYAHDLSLKK